MKKYIGCLFLFILSFFFTIDVNAQTYSLNELIPVDTVATVDAEKLSYNDFVFSTAVNEKGNSIINFSSIQNKTNEKIPVSINILLFDAEKKNIGFLAYCTDKDVSTDYNGFKLAPNGSTSFSINVVPKYFVENKTVSDVRYVAVMDDNKYCHIGGNDKYVGLTIEKISGGHVAIEKSEKISSVMIVSFLKNNIVKIIFTIFFVVFVVIVIEGIFINALHKKIYNDGTILSFVPVANSYLCVKLSFGPNIAKYYLIAFLASILLSVFGIPFLTLILSLVNIISFFIVIFKLITKKYDLFSGISNGLSTSKSSIKDDFVNYSTKNQITNDNAVEKVPDVNSEPVFIEKALDLNYENGSINIPNEELSSLNSASSNSVGNSDLSNLFSSSSSENTNSEQISSNQGDLFDQTLSSSQESAQSSDLGDLFNPSSSSNTDNDNNVQGSDLGDLFNSSNNNTGANIDDKQSSVDNLQIDSNNQEDLFNQTLEVADNGNDSDRSKELMNSIFDNNSSSTSDSNVENNVNNISVSSNNNSNNEGESDLAKFFK